MKPFIFVWFSFACLSLSHSIFLSFSRSYVSHCHRNPCVICGSHSVDVFSAAHLQRISFRDALVRCEDYSVTICTDLRLKRTTYESHPKNRTKKNFTTLRIVTFRWAQWKGRSKRRRLPIETATATITNWFFFQFFFSHYLVLWRSPTTRETNVHERTQSHWIRLAAAAGSITNTFHITDRFSCLFAYVLCKCKARTKDNSFCVYGTLWRPDGKGLSLRSSADAVCSACAFVLANEKVTSEKIASGSHFCFVPNKKDWKEIYRNSTSRISHTFIRRKNILKHTIAIDGRVCVCTPIYVQLQRVYKFVLDFYFLLLQPSTNTSTNIYIREYPLWSIFLGIYKRRYSWINLLDINVDEERDTRKQKRACGGVCSNWQVEHGLSVSVPHEAHFSLLHFGFNWLSEKHNDDDEYTIHIIRFSINNSG